MPENIAIRYVSNGGSDVNDGVSWAAAKRTIYGALLSLPGGGTKTAGSGTVYVGPDVQANAASASDGIWLMGPKDPNYASPPAGWLKCNGCAVNIIGNGNAAGGPNGHKPRVQLIAGGNADRNHPAIWLSATAQPIYIANFEIAYPARAVVIAECSNNDRTGTCGSQSIILDNVSALLTQAAANGPCTDVVSNVFWLWLRDYGCSGNAYTATGGITADNAAAILLDGTSGTGSGLIHIIDTNLAGGGIKVKGGSNGVSLYAKNVIQEGNFASASPPTVWFTGWCNAGCDAVLDNIEGADFGTGSMPNIEIDSTNTNGPTVLNSGNVQGPATIINPPLNSLLTNTVSPRKQGQAGFFNGYMVGNTDLARRVAGLVPNRFTNYGLSETSSWKFPVGSAGVTFKQGLTDPYGGTGAASVAYNTSSNNVVQMGIYGPYTPAVGDWFVAGVWAKGLAQTGTSFNTSCYGVAAPTYSNTFSDLGMLVGDGQWQYLWIAQKVGATAPSTDVCVDANFSNKLTPTLYGPTLYYIPAWTISDNEVLEFASTMNSVDPSCQVGQICNIAGHPLVVSSYGTLSNCRSAALPAKCDSAPAGSFVLEAGSTTARVDTTAVTANSQILIIEDSSLGANLGVPCNKTTGRTYMITDRVPGLSFTVRSSFAPTDHPACLSFQLLN
jgi:hypothetical protein